MSTKLKNKILYAAIFVLFVLVSIHAVKCTACLKQYADMIFICYPEGGARADALDQLRENDKGKSFSAAALWKFNAEAAVSAENTGRRKKARLCQIKGQPGAVFGNGYVYGRYFTEEEDAACLLDQGLARELFGSENVLGMEVEAEGKIYRVAGILKGSQSVCAVPAEENTGFDGVAVRKREDGQSSALAVSLVEAVFGNTDGQKVDGQLYFMTAALCCALALALMLLAAGTAVLRRGNILSGCVFGVCVTASVWVVLSGVKIAAPGADYLPTYWSDFDFFSRVFHEKAAQIQGLAAHQTFLSWSDMLHAWAQAIGAEIFAVILLGIFAVCVNAHTTLHSSCP